MVQYGLGLVKLRWMCVERFLTIVKNIYLFLKHVARKIAKFDCNLEQKCENGTIYLTTKLVWKSYIQGFLNWLIETTSRDCHIQNIRLQTSDVQTYVDFNYEIIGSLKPFCTTTNNNQPQKRLSTRDPSLFISGSDGPLHLRDLGHGTF